MRALFNSLLLLLCCATLAGATTPVDVLKGYYSAYQKEDLNLYYSTIDTASMTAEELRQRQQITTTLWKRFDTLDVDLSEIRVKQDTDSAFVYYHLESEILGYDENAETPSAEEIEAMPEAMKEMVQHFMGKATATLSEDLVAIVVQSEGHWKVNAVIEQDQMNATLQALFLLDQAYQPPSPPAAAPEPQTTATGAKTAVDPAATPATSTGQWLEAENESSRLVSPEAGGGKFTSHEGFSGAGYWYLAQEGDWLMHMLDVQTGGVHYFWIRDYNDGQHPPGARAVEVLIDDTSVAEVPAHNLESGNNWGWHIAARVELQPGTHIVMVRKEATTSAAALIDAYYITAEISDFPRQLP